MVWIRLADAGLASRSVVQAGENRQEREDHPGEAERDHIADPRFPVGTAAYFLDVRLSLCTVRLPPERLTKIGLDALLCCEYGLSQGQKGPPRVIELLTKRLRPPPGSHNVRGRRIFIQKA